MDLSLAGDAPINTQTLLHRPPQRQTSQMELKTPRTGVLLNMYKVVGLQKQHGQSLKDTNTPKRTPISVLHATLSPVSVPESGLSVLLGNLVQRKLSVQDATASRSHWVEPVSRATMEQGLNGTVMKHHSGLCCLISLQKNLY